MTTSARVERLSIHDNEVKQSDNMANLFRSLVVEFIGDLIFIFIGTLLHNADYCNSHPYPFYSEAGILMPPSSSVLSLLTYGVVR